VSSGSGGGGPVLRLGPETEKRLRAQRVRVEGGDENTAILRGVATNARFFNKPVTNLLVKRARATLPFLLCVDEDLEYLGQNPGVAQVFAGGACLRGWRILATCSDVAGGRMDDLVGSGLAILGSEGREPVLSWPLVTGAAPAAWPSLSRWGQELFTSEEPATTIGRDEEVEQVAAALAAGEPLMPVILGESGAGKTSVARAALQRVGETLQGRAYSIDLGLLLAGVLVDAERESRMAVTLGECRQACVEVLVVENLQLGLAGSTHVPFLLAAALGDGLRVIGTMGPRERPLLDRPPLARRVVSVTLIEPRKEETAAILRARLAGAEDDPRVAVSDELLGLVVETAARLVGVFPAKAIALIDVAVSRARLMGARALSSEHIQIAASGFAEQMPRRRIAAR
jgi:hypothetical protein